MEHRPQRKQLNSDTKASKKTYLKEIQQKRKEETFFLEKNKKKRKTIFKKKKKKRKEGPKKYLPRRLKK